jgi:hypothetical protein
MPRYRAVLKVSGGTSSDLGRESSKLPGHKPHGSANEALEKQSKPGLRERKEISNKVWRNALKPGEKDCEPVKRQYQLCESCMPDAEADVSAGYDKFFNMENGFWKFGCAMEDPDYEDETVYRWRDISELKNVEHETPTLRKGRLCQECFNYVLEFGGNPNPPEDKPPTLASRVQMYFKVSYEEEEDQEAYELKHEVIPHEE